MTMLALISPAKRFADSVAVSGSDPVSRVPFLDKTKALVTSLAKQNQSDLMSLMSISQAIASLNVERFQQMLDIYSDYDQNADGMSQVPAVFGFQGDVYKSLQPESLDHDARLFLQEHLGILSGLYGLLRPFDLICPHRLEMATRFGVDGASNLYDYWSDTVTAALNQWAKDTHAACILNVASADYIKVVDREKLVCPMIDLVFKHERGGKIKTIGLLAKRDRGRCIQTMARQACGDWESLLDGIEEDWGARTHVAGLSEDRASCPTSIQILMPD